MPTIQQSATKSTGGKSDRKRLYRRPRPESDEEYMDSDPPSTSGAPEAPVVPMTTRQRADKADVSFHVLWTCKLLTPLQWCYSCVDGGGLMSCDLCDRTICDKCVTLQTPTGDIHKLGYQFACPTCHTQFYFNLRKTYSPYFVCAFHLFMLNVRT
jgi:hypothetical protein